MSVAREACEAFAALEGRHPREQVECLCSVALPGGEVLVVSGGWYGGTVCVGDALVGGTQSKALAVLEGQHIGMMF